VTRTVLQNVVVLSAGQTMETDGKNPAITTPVVTLLVTPGDAEALTLATNEGHIQLVLRKLDGPAIDGYARPGAERPVRAATRAGAHRGGDGGLAAAAAEEADRRRRASRAGRVRRASQAGAPAQRRRC